MKITQDVFASMPLPMQGLLMFTDSIQWIGTMPLEAHAALFDGVIRFIDHGEVVDVGMDGEKSRAFWASASHLVMHQISETGRAEAKRVIQSAMRKHRRDHTERRETVMRLRSV